MELSLLIGLDLVVTAGAAATALRVVRRLAP